MIRQSFAIVRHPGAPTLPPSVNILALAADALWPYCDVLGRLQLTRRPDVRIKRGYDQPGTSRDGAGAQHGAVIVTGTPTQLWHRLKQTDLGLNALALIRLSNARLQRNGPAS